MTTIVDPASDPSPSADDAPAIIHLVPHTHWDREWYEPFQTFRMRLVELVDGLLDGMEADRRLAFTLDGQVATVDDYLEVRPDGRARIERLIAEGRLAIGPWQILMDEFLVSGETIVRNLELGWHAAEALGRAMPIGYLPDMFGHIAQMPQILRRAGIDQAVVWRGVPAAIDHHAFTWASPDGSTVRTEYLVGGYGNGAYLLAIPDRLGEKVGRYFEGRRSFYGDRSVLAMYGTDHAVPSPRLADIVAQANAARSDIAVRIETLSDYIGGVAASTDTLPTHTGELRSAARANMLMNVASARMDIKAAAARAERLLERYAEPLAALHDATWPERLLELAWRRLIDNSAHDSICGCSHDAVVDQVLTRFAEAEQIARGVIRMALRGAAASAPHGGWSIVNPSPRERADLVELEVDSRSGWQVIELELAGGRRVPTQTIERPESVLRRMRLTGSQLSGLFERRLHGRELFGHSLDGHRIDRDGPTPRLDLLMDDPSTPDDFDVDELIDAVRAATASDLDQIWDVVVLRGDRQRIVAAIPVPALGWSVAHAVDADESVDGVDSALVGVANPVVVEEWSLANHLVRLEVADDGTFSLAGDGVRLTGVGRIVDGGDFGDSYNYAPPTSDTLVDAPTSVAVRALEHGPLRGRLEIVRTYPWPRGVLSDGRTRTELTDAVEVTTQLELRADESFVRVTITFDNPARDHRVRWHIPLPVPTDRSMAEGQFAVVERGLTFEAGHGEVATPTYPAHGFVHAAGVSALLDHLTEYEVVDGRELALTVLRCTGLISRNDNPFREDPAGPEVPIPGAQMLGPSRFGFALQPHAGSWAEADVLGSAEAYHLPFLVADGKAPRDTSDGPAIADRPDPGSIFALAGNGVVLSSLRRRGDWLEARLVAESSAPTRAHLDGPFEAACEADLLGRPGPTLELDADSGLQLELGPWEIRTVQLRQRR